MRNLFIGGLLTDVSYTVDRRCHSCCTCTCGTDYGTGGLVRWTSGIAGTAVDSTVVRLWTSVVHRESTLRKNT